MLRIDISADSLISRLLDLSVSESVCILDSSRSGHKDSPYLIAGIKPIKTLERTRNSKNALADFESFISERGYVAVFTMSYEFGESLAEITSGKEAAYDEPYVFCTLFDRILVHDYRTGESYITGSNNNFDEIADLIFDKELKEYPVYQAIPDITSNFTKEEYIKSVEQIREFIRSGITYQTNLTQQFTATFNSMPSPQKVFEELRFSNQAPFSAFITRPESTVVSSSPERFFRIKDREITVSPIKGTRKRGVDHIEDEQLRRDLSSSNKDRAENIMIVDLLRNDLGRICEYGSVKVKELCAIEEHPTLFHLVSTVKGKLGENISFSEIIRSLFPCGSITGAPKISTMKIINNFERIDRGLSMGAIGVIIPPDLEGLPAFTDLNVAIRTMVFTGDKAVFNVGGGIVIDSDPELEYEESLLKAKALIASLGVK